MIEKRGIYFAKRDHKFCPVGTAAFILHFPPCSYSQPVSGVMIEFPILELYLAARLVYLLGLITVLSVDWKVKWREGVRGGLRYRQTDKSYILISCSLFTLI